MFKNIQIIQKYINVILQLFETKNKKIKNNNAKKKLKKLTNNIDNETC